MQTTFSLYSQKAWAPCLISYFSTVCEAVFSPLSPLMHDIILSLFTAHSSFVYTSLNWVSNQVNWPPGLLGSNKESGISISGRCCVFKNGFSGLLSQIHAKAIHMLGQSNSMQPHPIPWVQDNMFWALMLHLLLPIKCNALRRHVGNTLKKTFRPHQDSLLNHLEQ